MINNGKLKYLCVGLGAIFYLIWVELRYGWTIKESLDYFSLFFNLGLGLMIVTLLVKKSKVKTIYHFVLVILFSAYFCELYGVTLGINFTFYSLTPYTGNYHIMFNYINWVPFKTIIHTFSSPLSTSTIIQLLGNILLLTPLAFSLRYLEIIYTTKWTILTTFFTSISIEVLQLINTFIISGFETDQGRSTDIDDVILNTIGGVIGVLIFIGLKRFFIKNKKKSNYANGGVHGKLKFDEKSFQE